jgi:hypothetical protein
MNNENEANDTNKTPKYEKYGCYSSAHLKAVKLTNYLIKNTS